MKLLMIGLGSIGQRHLRNIRRLYGNSVDILAYRVRGLKRTFSDDMKIRENISLEEEYGIRSFSDLEEALKEKPEAAFVTNPTRYHIPCAIACAQAGCHIFLEKPISDSREGILELLRISEEKNRKVFVGFQNRFHPGMKYVKNCLEAGELGKILSVRAVVGERLTTMHTYEDYKDTYMARKDLGGGVVLNQMIHELDYLYDLFGKPESVYAVGGITGNLDIDVEDNCDAIYKVRTGMGSFPVSVHGDFYQSPPSRFMKVVGEKGQVTLNLLNATVVKSVNDITEEIRFEDFTRNDMFLEELKLFMECVEQDREPAISLKDGIVSFQMAMAAKQSMETGGIVYDFSI